MTTSTVVLRTEARLMAREPGPLFMIVLFPALLLAILGAVPAFREPSADLGGQSLVALYTQVCVLLAMIVAAMTSLPGVILGYRETGVLRRLRTTPLDPAALLGAQVVMHAAAVAASVALTLGVGRLVFGVPLPGSPGWYVVALLLAFAATAAIGAVVTAVAPNQRVGQSLGMVVFFPLMFTSGVYFPVEAMGGTLRAVVELTPLGAGVQALTAAGIGDRPELVDLAVTAGWAAAVGLVAVLAVRRR